MSLTGNSHPIVTSGSRVSRAPPHHTLRGDLPAFINLHGRKKNNDKIFAYPWERHNTASAVVNGLSIILFSSLDLLQQQVRYKEKVLLDEISNKKRVF